MSSFQYPPLQIVTDSIRLLRLEKGTLSNDIVGHLFETYIEEAPTYSALSYTWETDKHVRDRESICTISIDGHGVQVKENLYTALRHIRREGQDITLWIDAICINQSNAAELGHQVKQMGNIYSAAEEVLIWLGLGDEADERGTRILFESINWMDAGATQAQAIGSSSADWVTLCRRFMSDRPADMLRTEPLQRQALRALLARPWFTRVWVLQEVAMAKMARVLCGPYACPARSFALMPSLIGLDVRDHTQAILDIMPRIRRSTWWSSERDLHSLLDKFAASESQRPKDKVYALLGLSQDACDPRLFYPDYVIPDDEAFRNTASFLLFGEVLDPGHAFPEFSMEDMRLPIARLAQMTLEWALSQHDPRREPSRRTAALLVHRINEGRIRREDLLPSLAATYGQASEIRDILARGDADVNIVFGNGGDNSENALTVASRAQPTLQEKLVYRSTRGPVLFSAPFEEDEDMALTIRRLAEGGSSKEEILRAQAWAGDRHGVQSQLYAGADVNSADRHGRTALHLATWRKHTETMYVLLDNGASVTQKDARGQSAFHYAMHHLVTE